MIWYIDIWSSEEGKTVYVLVQRIVESEVPLRKAELAEGSSARYLHHSIHLCSGRSIPKVSNSHSDGPKLPIRIHQSVMAKETVRIPVIDISASNHNAANELLNAAAKYGFVFVENNEAAPTSAKDIHEMFNLVGDIPDHTSYLVR